MVRFLLGSMRSAFATPCTPKTTINHLSVSHAHKLNEQNGAHLQRVGDGVEDGGEAPAADADLRLRL